MYRGLVVGKELWEDWYNVGKKVTRCVQTLMSFCFGIISIPLNILINSSLSPYGPEAKPESGP